MTEEKSVDENGVPINYGDLMAAPYCPDEPCKFCTGNSNVVTGRNLKDRTPIYMPSWEWCQKLKTCASTVDWERVHREN